MSQVSLFPDSQDESLAALDQLFRETRTYKRSREFANLLRFIKRFPNYAPFNCLLLHTQNPSVRYVATPEQWRKRFERRVKPDTRPLVILAPMSPVLFVYDITDTEGKPVPPQLLDPFAVTGALSAAIWQRTLQNCARDLITVVEHEMHVNFAGKIGPATAGETVQVFIKREKNGDMQFETRHARYRLVANRKQSLPARYVTLVHELAHLYCGHIGTPNEKWWQHRQHIDAHAAEFEAESVAYLIAARLGLENPSARYLSGYLRRNGEIPDISIDTVLKVAGLIERMGREWLLPRKEKS